MAYGLNFEAEPFSAYEAEFDYEWAGEASRGASARPARGTAAPAPRRLLKLPGKRTAQRPPGRIISRPGRAASASAAQAAPAPAVVKIDSADTRIDVGAKFSLQRMLKCGDAQQDAARLIQAVNSKRLAGIYGDDLKAAVDVARRLGTQRWLLVPKGEDAALVVDPSKPLSVPPTIIFRGDTPDIRSNPTRIDLALQKASRTFQLWDSGQLGPCKGGTISAEVWEGEDPLPPDTTPLPGVVPPIVCRRSTVIIPVKAPPITAADVPGLFAKALVLREGLNRDNLRRTAFYLTYWEQTREVPWALLAHLVSRNAGYQMTDLTRYANYLMHPVTAALIFGISIFTSVQLLSLQRFIEAGNFLIFHDVFPQLAAYSLAKSAFKLTGDESLSLQFFDRLPAEGVDALIVSEWKRFFVAAVKANFWEGVAEPEKDPNVIRHSHALVVNEQNYIEDRLLAPLPGAPTFIAISQQDRDDLFTVSDLLGLTKLLFTSSSPTNPATPALLFLNTVKNFKDLTSRVRTGRMLYFGTFLKDSARTERIKLWASKGQAHTGSRTDYDSVHFTMDANVVSARAAGQISSVAVKPGPMPAWPGPPPSSLRNWSTEPARTALFTSSLPVLAIDPFNSPEGEALAATPDRPTREVVF